LAVITRRLVRASDPSEMPLSDTRLGRLHVLKQMLHAVSSSRPGAKKPMVRRVVTHFARCAYHLEAFRDRFGDVGNLALQEALALRPSLMASVIHPYLNVDWRFDQKLDAISGHYQLLTRRLGILRFAPHAALILADLADATQIRLHKSLLFEHEGELTVSLFKSDQRLYSLTFTLGQIGAELVAYAGGLQGLRSPEAIEIYRSLTHHMHGLRPRDLLVTAFRLLCGSLGVARILAISDSKRICSNSYHCPGEQIFSSYDNAWIECGAVPMDDAFFELSPRLTQRSAPDIPSRKRAQYRRRYAMVDAIAQQIGDAVGTSAPGSRAGRIGDVVGAAAHREGRGENQPEAVFSASVASFEPPSAELNRGIRRAPPR
jgi:uncharacterized protein VirK/YbjX